MINTVVLAEDNLEHCFFFKQALREVAPSAQFTEVHDGEKLLQLLRSFLPDLLFLDLNMPCRDGMQCISEIREDRTYDALPIIVFTIARRNNSIQAAYGFGANLYFVKPNEYSELVSSLKLILSMDWSDPKAIREKHFQADKYHPFKHPA